MTDVWHLRAHRATTLATERAHAAEVLTFYTNVLASQTTAYRAAKHVSDFSSLVNKTTLPWLPLTTLPFKRLGNIFGEFIETLKPHAPQTTSDLGTILLTTGPVTVLTWFASGSDSSPVDPRDYDRKQLEFYPRAFLQAILQTVTESLDPEEFPSNRQTCSLCGALPQLSMLQDEPGALGQRRLLCSLCLSRWRFARVICPSCRESSSEKLFRHEQEGDHVSIEECTTCNRYLKSIDLRKHGRADPVVDEMATIELDLWATERNIKKIQPNLLGF